MCRHVLRCAFVFVALFTGLAAAVHAQPAPGADSTAAPPRLKLFLDCDESVCDFEFLRQELGWVDWLRDRQGADVHVLLTTRATASGGVEATFYVTRPHGGGPASDTVRVFAPASTSDDEDRHLLLRTLQAILARDLAERPEGARLRVALAGEPAGAAGNAAPAVDRWDHWVMKLSGRGFFNGQRAFRSFNTFGDASASRVVESSKLAVSGFGSYSEQRFTEPRFVGVQRSWGANTRGVKSLGGRWSAGGRVFVNSSKFSNQHLLYGAGPAVEFDVWPYSESSRRLLTLAYEVTARRVRYDQVTLYGKTRETLFLHGLTTKLSLTQPWGSVSLAPDLSQYLHDGSKYRATLSLDTELELVRGFSLSLSAFASRIRDQLSLPRGDASDDEVLLQQRQLATSYQYFGSFGITYRFGSSTNNVVNPRMADVYGSF